ncbi:SAV_2336 N-terminal domain-related protein [Streptomyces sp. NPDC057386]|uniref:SAV_2336 N-terminal domain-related protein n=1 Tax=unclassified Streptomyces TaxID=2593676 RepID=UPI003628CBFC
MGSERGAGARGRDAGAGGVGAGARGAGADGRDAGADGRGAGSSGRGADAGGTGSGVGGPGAGVGGTGIGVAERGTGAGAQDIGVTPLDRLSALLTAAAGSAPTPRELAEALWLARQLSDAEGAAEQDRDTAGARAGEAHPPGRPPAPPAVPPYDPHTDQGSPPPPLSPAPPAARATAPGDRIPLRLPAPRMPDGPDGVGRRLLAPAPPMLHHPLALQRALRPLGRRVPSPRARVLDERATVERIARLGAAPDTWVPVLRPAPDRWLRLNLVHDTGPTMPVWRPLVRELHALLAQSGLFRTVTLHPAGPDGRVRHVPDPGDGRTATLIVSDCAGPQWRPGPPGERWYRTLRRWSARMPVAVVQPLPEHLWPGTALPATPGVLASPAAAAPSAALTFSPYDPDAPPAPPGALPLPVLEPGAPWLAHWAHLVASVGGGRAPGAVAWLRAEPLPPAAPAPDPAAAGAEELVLRFRATASPEAFRLAGHLALAEASAPVMRLVQHTVERAPRPQHLAEVILSGMLRAVPGPPGSYDFRPGVRELLLRSLPRSVRSRTRAFLDEMGVLIDERAGLAAGEFEVTAGAGAAPDTTDGGPGDSGEHAGATGEGAGDGAAGPAGAVFATVSEETVRRLGGAPTADGTGHVLGGRYLLVERRGPGMRMWEAEHLPTGRRVVVHRCPEQRDPALFAAQAHKLAKLDHPHVVRVLDHDVEGRSPYLVTEFVDGVTLTELLRGPVRRLSFRAFVRLLVHGRRGLRALHAQGLVRGQHGTQGLLLRPDGTVLISRFALGEESRGRNARTDEQDFLRLLRELARDIAAAPDLPWYGHLADLTSLLGDGDLARAARLATGLEELDIGGPERTYTLLGPPRITSGDRELDLPSPRALAMLFMLLHAEGRRVTRAELARGLWENPPPPGELLTHLTDLAAELRGVVADGSLVDLPDGWALHIPDDHLDLRDLEQAIKDPERLRHAHGLFHGDPLDGIPGPAAAAARTRLRSLRDQLALEARPAPPSTTPPQSPQSPQSAPSTPPPASPRLPTIAFLADRSLSHLPETRITLEYAVHQMLSRGSLTPDRYEVRVRDDGYEVSTEPGSYLLPVLVAILRGLPEMLSGLSDGGPGLNVLLCSDDSVPPTPDQLAGITPHGSLVVTVCPALYAQFMGSSAAQEPYRFQPLLDGGPDTPPVAWYCPLTEDDGGRELVRGPFITQDLRRLGVPAPGRTAIVHQRPDGPLTLLDPADPYSGERPDARTYYEVDLTPQHGGYRVSLPSSGKGAFAAAVELFWHVDDPVAFVGSETEHVAQPLLDHLVESASRITRRHPLRRAGAAQRAVNAGVGDWPVPGLSVSYSVVLAPEGAPLPVAAPSETKPPALPDLLAGAETVLLGFEGPVARLYSARAAEEAVRELLDVVTGQGRGGGPAREAFEHPLDVLRAYARDPLGPLLRSRLDEIELRAVPGAPTTHNAVALVRRLHESGRRVAVVSDVHELAVLRYVDPYRLPLAGVHGRGKDLTLLTPDPDCVVRGLGGDAAAPHPPALLVSSSPAEVAAAQRLGVPCVGLPRNASAERDLRDAGCALTVRTLRPLLDAARTL